MTPRPLAAMWSFKVKLVLWFALLALLPLGVAFYGYDALAKRSETRRVDAGLEAGLRGAVAAYASRLDAAGTAGLALAELAPQEGIDSAVRAAEGRVLFALVVSLVLIATVTYLLGRSIVLSLRRFADAANAIASGRLGERVEVRGHDEFAEVGQAFNRMAAQLELRLAELERERSRVREATARFGEALVATHDPEELMRVAVESAGEATGAAGGGVIGPGREPARG